MKLSQMNVKNAINENPPQCVFNATLDKYLSDPAAFSSVVLALTFDSGSAANPTARSYVFHFFYGEADANRRPDDIVTFKIRFDDPLKVQIIDKYLGGMAYGAKNAPPLATRHLWKPGMMSAQSKEEFRKAFSKTEEKKSGCFIATAACGTPLAEEVIWLSRFRDDVLAKRTMGVNFINFYYKVSPPIAERIACRNWAKAAIRMVVISPLSKLARWVVD